MVIRCTAGFQPKCWRSIRVTVEEVVSSYIVARSCSKGVDRERQLEERRGRGAGQRGNVLRFAVQRVRKTDDFH